MDLEKYRKMFVEEAREHLAAASRRIVALEKSPADPSIVNELFRSAHSVKGMAASLGYAEICELAHSLEDLLDVVRRQERAVDRPLIDLLLRGNDLLEQMVSDIEAGGEAGGGADLCREIRALLSGAAAAPPARPAAPPPATAGPGGDGPPGGRLRVSFRISPDSVSPGARGFLAVRALEDLGDVRALRPELGVIKSGRYGRVIDAELGTDLPPDHVAGVLGALVEVRDVRVEAADAVVEAPADPASPSRPETSTAPAANTVRVKTEVLDRFMDTVGELILNKAELREITRGIESEPLLEALLRLETTLESLKRQALGVRLTPLEGIFGRLPRVVRDLGQARGREARLELRGGTLELDRAIVEALADPLVHLARNAVDHGIEPPGERVAAGKDPEGRILVEAYREKDVAVIHVEDDGRGLDPPRIREAAVARGILRRGDAAALDDEGVRALLFLPGMSTAAEVSEVSGRGVGLDAVKSSIQALGGSVTVSSRPSAGTQFTLRVPFSASILNALVVRVGEDLFALPFPKVLRALDVEGADLVPGSAAAGGGWFCRCEEELLPARPLAHLLGFAAAGSDADLASRAHGVVVAETRTGRAALLVDAFAGQEEVFVRPLAPPLSQIEALSGITVLGSGRPVLVVDPNSLGKAPVPVAGNRRRA